MMMAMARHEKNKAVNNDLNASDRAGVDRNIFRLLLEIESRFRAEDRKNREQKQKTGRDDYAINGQSRRSSKERSAAES
jgi:hypothetical protein